jgi:Tannase and feruloyl esterase
LALSDWDGRFVQVGNGGLAGSINNASLLQQLKSRHAVAATDDGHSGAGTDGSWALEHPEN